MSRGRKNGCGGETDAAQLDPGFIEDLTELHRYQFEVGCQPLVVAGRKGIQQTILMEAMALLVWPSATSFKSKDASALLTIRLDRDFANSDAYFMEGHQRENCVRNPT
jgi:hypothetical protein